MFLEKSEKLTKRIINLLNKYNKINNKQTRKFIIHMKMMFAKHTA